MVNHEIVNVNDIKYLYNGFTGLFFEIDDYVESAFRNINLSCETMPKELYSNLKKNYFVKFNISRETTLNFYPVVSKYVIWNNSMISFMLFNELHIKNLTEIEKGIFSLCSGTNTIKDILQVIPGIDYDNLMQIIIKWVGFDRQIIKLFDEPFCHEDNVFFSSFINPSIRHEETGIIDESHYYESIEDVELQFDTLETTISYMFRKRSEILDGCTYGYKFASEVMREHLNKLNDIRILEVGGGLGDFAFSYNTWLQDNCSEYSYDILDISTELIKSQRSKCSNFMAKMEFINSDVSCIDKLNKKYDLVISNEVISDFVNIRIDQEMKMNNSYYKKYSLENSVTKDNYINVGAIKFIEDIYDVLDNEGMAFISEYTEADGSSQVSNCMSDHKEVSINFDVLLNVAEQIGYRAEVLSLTDFLKIDDSVEVLSRMSYINIKNILSLKGRELDKVFYTKKEVKDFRENMNNIEYTSLKRMIKFFKIIILKKE